jgi:hypothetical protein
MESSGILKKLALRALPTNPPPTRALLHARLLLLLLSLLPVMGTELVMQEVWRQKGRQVGLGLRGFLAREE